MQGLYFFRVLHHHKSMAKSNFSFPLLISSLVFGKLNALVFLSSGIIAYSKIQLGNNLHPKIANTYVQP